ncbi:hypothetical protein AB0L59_39455 [Streptomyces sp. NPDC052109]|uniref:hypothetical protein n=1 Tax=Streptomyces sp. NPDC052109 TaxID=3155527 RepID=UPI0034243905
MTDLDTLSVNTIRGLCTDAVQKANAGHPGTPMGMAPVAHTLWQRFLRLDPADPVWPHRDRFVLCEGHASALLWSLPHLTGVRTVDPRGEVLGRPAVTLDDLKSFRQIGSRCPGHPEYPWTSGVETTTGPLGQEVATSVGMAVAGRWLGAGFSRGDFTLFDFGGYALAGDGCTMEGVSAEAASLAGRLQLSNPCWIYDSDRVTIDGHTDIAFTEDVGASRAFHTCRAESERPPLVLVHSPIGYSTVEDPPKAHGTPFGPEGSHQARPRIPPDADFHVPDGVPDRFARGIGARGAGLRTAWERTFDACRSALPAFPADPKGLASRDPSGQVLDAVAEAVPWFLGGPADLTPSTKTRLTFAGARG